MRTYENFREVETNLLRYLLSNATTALGNLGENDRNRKGWEDAVQYYNKALRNIDEYTAAVIARLANDFIEAIKKQNKIPYYRNLFSSFPTRYFEETAGIGFKSDGSFVEKKGAAFSTSIKNAFSMFLMEVQDLELFVGKAWYIDDTVRDEFMQHINRFYGINIPMSSELEGTRQAFDLDDKKSLFDYNCVQLRNGECFNGGTMTVFKEDIINKYGNFTVGQNNPTYGGKII